MNVIERYHKHLNETRNEKKAATLTMKDLAKEDPSQFDAINEVAEETTFSVRNYGHGAFYSWPRHQIFNDVAIDPWPASRWPKAALCMEIARLIEDDNI